METQLCVGNRDPLVQLYIGNVPQIEGVGLLIFPADATVLRAGETATVQVLDDEFFAGAESAF